MSNVLLKNILEACFRANPGYQLFLFDRLPPEQQDALRDLTADPDFFGVLVPCEDGKRNTKSVCRDTALLLFALGQPGPLPTYVRAMLGENCNQAVAELVLDEVLQIESQGAFVCGSAAYDLIYHRRPDTDTEGALPRLTRAALEYGQALDIDEAGKISARLYFYNRVPLSPSWKRRFPGQDSVASYLGIESGGAIRRYLEGHWARLKPSSQFEGWFQWQTLADKPPEAGARQVYKLYVSPQPEFVREAFQAFVEALTDSPAHHFKVGWDAAGLLRPDKMVAYFWNFETLREAANQIGTRLSGCRAQGVPFTAALQDNGLLSWGIDPVAEKGTLSWQERPSWRLWITNRLATALVAAKSAGNSGVEPWRFALERLRLENVDTDTWTPLETFGRAEAVA
ncbi:MAG TPA: hypothetical protein VE959_16520 [Bryobacteraceae bacterium]|nr:hypothetical protein [Bryobacteraceae bacterium]